jgi:hypothetical protein
MVVKKNIYVLIFITLFITIILSNLKCTIECTLPVPDDSSFIFSLIDKATGKNMIGDKAFEHTKYDYRKVDLINGDGSKIEQNGYKINVNNIAVNIVDFPSTVTGQEVKKEYLLLLPDVLGNPDRHRDLIRFEYKLKKNDCPPIWYEYFRVYYNDSLYYQGEYKNIIDFYE